MFLKKRFSHSSPVLPLIAILGIILVCVPDLLRAQSDQLTDTQTQWVEVLNNVIWIASRIWIIPMKIAGLLMTNYFIYGESFYLVDYLFKFWQIIRTFALYGLWLYFVWYILYSWFNPQEAKSKIAELFKNTLIAWILISMSRWLIAASIDISIVFTSAVAAIPSQIYEQDRSKKQQCFTAPKEILIEENYLPNKDLMGNETNYRSPTRESIKPNGDDIWPPLMFIGTAVLRFFDMSYLPEQNIQWSAEWTEQRQLSKTLIVVAVKAFLLLLLLIPMVILMVVNMIRVVCLWIRIIFSPGIVLINIFDLKVSDQLGKYLSRQNILGLIMQPVAVIGMLSIGFIFIVELASIFNMCIQQQENSPLAVTPISEWVDAPIGEMLSPIWSETTLWASLSAVGDVVGGITWQLIVAIFVIMLFWALIKIGFSFSELTSWTAKSMTDGIEKMASTVPLVPLPGVGAIGTWAAQKFAKWNFWMNDMITKRWDQQEQLLREKLWFNKGEISRPDLRKLQNKAETVDTPLTELQKEVTTQIEKKYIKSNDAKQVLKSWFKSSWKRPENIKAIKNLWLSTLANWLEKNLLTDEELEKIWEKSDYSTDAYKLLNWLFWKWWQKATDYSSATQKFGGAGDE